MMMMMMTMNLVFCTSSFCTSILSTKSNLTHLNAFKSPSDRAAGCSFSNFTHPFTCDHKTKEWNNCIQPTTVNSPQMKRLLLLCVLFMMCIKQICYGKGVSGPVCPLSISGIKEFRLHFCTGTLRSKRQTHFHFGLYQSNINPTLYTWVLWSFSKTQLTLKSTTLMSNHFESDIYLTKYKEKGLI
jgi:hypothetical protein